MCRGRPTKENSSKHPLNGQFNGDVPWLNGCKKFDSCFSCQYPLDECYAENPRLHKGGRPKKTKIQALQ